MTIDKARRLKQQIYRQITALSKHYPCEHCDGTGDSNFRGGMYDPCPECYGMGFQVPDEDEEDEDADD